MKVPCGLCLVLLLAANVPSEAQVVFPDEFNQPVDYLTNGVSGTIWDGVYFGAGEFSNTSIAAITGTIAGSTSDCDADISTTNVLTVTSTGTGWENAEDDGFFLFKNVTGDFSVRVHILTPYDNGQYNTAGLLVRAAGPNGNPYGGTENYVSWTRFNQYGFGNYLRNEVNGVVTQINPNPGTNAGQGTNDTNYWLRIDRVGNTFNYYSAHYGPASNDWVQVPPGTAAGAGSRPDWAGLPLEVGIMHAVFEGSPPTHTAKFEHFSLTASNLTAVATPPPATDLTLTLDGAGNLALSWAAGAGSAGSVAVVWTGTNNAPKEAPADGITYAGNAAYGQGSSLPATGYYVVFAGAGTNATVTGVFPGINYHAAVFAYAGAGNSITYSHTPAVASVFNSPQPLMAQASVHGTDVAVTFAAYPGKWYWLQYSDSLSPANWQNVVPGPVIATNLLMTLVHHGGFGRPQRFYRVLQEDPEFSLAINSGDITSLQRNGDTFPTEYLASGGDLGDTLIRYLQPGTGWNTAQTGTLSGIASATYSNSPDGTQYTADYQITNGISGTLLYESTFNVQQDAIYWTLNFTNLTQQVVVIGDLAVPLPMNTTFSGITSTVLKHSFISGYDSYLFWMRPDSVGPYLLMTPDDNTKLEYWDNLGPGTESFFLETLGGYEAYIHSVAAAANADLQYPGVTTQGERWRQPNTSLTLEPGASQSYGFKFQWVSNYDGVRQALVNEGKVDVHVVPGMTVPTNLFAEIALDTTQEISSVTAEFPDQTQLEFLGTTNVGTNTYQLYQVQFTQLGENELTISYGNARTMYLEFFATEPVETLVKKRAAFIAGKQVNDPTKWYNSLFCEWNMNDEVMLTPDDYDTLSGFVVYEVASDDPGESRPAYLATKESVFPVQSEVTALDNFIQNFVWGGLQRTTNETYSYGVYGIPDWHQLRTNNDLSLTRGYDYPHIVVMYYGMYQVAKYHPEITTYLTANQYLERAYGTAVALYTVAGGTQATQIGLMNEMITPSVIDSLQSEGMTNEAATLRGYWEQKVNFFVTGNPNLFLSEFPFDSTGFESQEALAKYAIQNAGSDSILGSTNVALFLQQARQFMSNEITANVFYRGWLEPDYYHYGSAYDELAGDSWMLDYMGPMGGWGLLDYGLNYATNATDYLRLGYASILSSWAIMNSGPPPNYGFWYPGAANDGGAGGGFEPGPFNTTWLGNQPMHRGAWYYCAEGNLGFCGAVRAAATILADDPIFGRFCYGGTWTNATNDIQITPLDGVRRQFHALLNNGNLHLVLDNDNFSSTQPLVLQPDLSAVSFAVETTVHTAHTAALHLTASIAGTYQITNSSGVIATVALQSGQTTTVALPMPAGTSPVTFTISR